MATSTNIGLVGGAILDVSGRSDGTLTLNAGQALTGEGTVRGSVMASSGSLVSPGTPAFPIGRLVFANALTFQDGGILQVDVDSASGSCDTLVGTASVTYGGALNLNGTFKAGQRLKLFDAAAYSGAFASIVPDMPGPNLQWDTSQLPVNGTLKVVSTVPLPVIESFQMVGTNLIVSGSGGAPSGSYAVLRSTNVSLPLIQWTPIATSQFNANGSFAFTNAVDRLSPQHFYLLRFP